MSTTLARVWSGNTIEQRATDGYFNATAMCQANGKLWADYWRLSTTSAYLGALSADMGIPITELVQVRQGGTPGQQGTWIHPDVAIHLAQWLSPTFAVQVSKWVRELLPTGTVAIDPTTLPGSVYPGQFSKTGGGRFRIPAGITSSDGDGRGSDRRQ